METTLRKEIADQGNSLREEIQNAQAATVLRVIQYLTRLEALIRQDR